VVIRPHNTASRRIATRHGMRLDHADSGELLFHLVDLNGND
jgi:hypothetical protein